MWIQICSLTDIRILIWSGGLYRTGFGECNRIIMGASIWVANQNESLFSGILLPFHFTNIVVKHGIRCAAIGCQDRLEYGCLKTKKKTTTNLIYRECITFWMNCSRQGGLISLLLLTTFRFISGHIIIVGGKHVEILLSSASFKWTTVIFKWTKYPANDSNPVVLDRAGRWVQFALLSTGLAT